MERRELLKWVAPAILTLPVFPSMARAGSNIDGEEGGWTVINTGYFDPSSPAPPQLFRQGSYQIMPGGQVYKLETNWLYQGQYGAILLPVGFPVLSLGASPIIVVPNL